MSDDYRIALRPDGGLNGGRPSDLLDDIVVKDVSMFRAEMMDDKSAWMCCYFPGTDELLTFWVRAVRRRGEKMRLEITATETPHGDGFTYEAES